MNLRTLPLLFALGLLSIALPVGSQPHPRSEAAQPGDEKDTDHRATIDDLGLTPEGIKRLREQKFLITTREFGQAFQPYANPHIRRAGAAKDDENADRYLPMFVTADSVLNAYHVLFEESVARLERRNALSLQADLARIWRKLPEAGHKDDPATGAAREWAQVIVGTAIRLSGGTCPGVPDPVAQTIEQNVKLAMAAKETRMPAGADPADDDPSGYHGVDFTRLKPRGFYAGDGVLEGYFRAVAWLQEVSFRLGKDREVIAAILIAPLLSDNLVTVSNNFDRLVGPPARPQLVRPGVRQAEPLTERVDGVRMAQLRLQLDELIREQPKRRAMPQREAQVLPRISILSPREVPEAELFRRTSAGPRLFPSGLDLLVALGSGHATRLMDDEKDGAAREAAFELSPLIRGSPEFGEPTDLDCLYLRYLYTIASLLEPAEPDAPDFLKSELWELKQCQTALAGWAQLRHTWVLQAEETVGLFSGSAGMPGFVEPVPTFWKRLGKLVSASQQLLQKNRALDADPNRTLLKADLQGSLGLIESAALVARGESGWKGLDPVQRQRLVTLVWSFARAESRQLPEEIDDRYLASQTPGLIRWLKSQVEAIDAGQAPDENLAERHDNKLDVIREGWTTLEIICERLETLSHRQLRKLPLAREDAEFLEAVGPLLGAVCFHNSSAAAYPRDDAPRIADIHTVAGLADRPVMHVGIGRPRELLVLYPWGGKEVLCRGAVLPYYEIRENDRLTDDRWRALLDRDSKPSMPAWTADLYRDGRVPEDRLK